MLTPERRRPSAAEATQEPTRLGCGRRHVHPSRDAAHATRASDAHCRDAHRRDAHRASDARCRHAGAIASCIAKGARRAYSCCNTAWRSDACRVASSVAKKQRFKRNWRNDKADLRVA